MNSPIASYTGRLRTELGVLNFGPGPSELTELRDGLEDAAEAHVRNGLTRTEAERRAVVEFGEPAEIARLFGPEIAARRTFRAAIALTLLYPALLGIWAAYASLFPDHHTDWRDGARIGEAFTLVGASCWVVAVTAAVLLRLRAGSLRLPVKPIVIGCSCLAFGSVAAITLLAYITVNSPTDDPLQARAELIVKSLSNGAVAGMLIAGVSSLRSAFLIRGRRAVSRD